MATLYVLDDPKLTPDYDRNGSVSSQEVERSGEGGQSAKFCFWVNDDNDSGNENDSANDKPGSGINGTDAKVNGRGDLLDFTPILVDIDSACPASLPIDLKNYLKTNLAWELQSSAVNAVFTKQTASDAGAFHREPIGTFGDLLNQDSHSATVQSLASGCQLPTAFKDEMDRNSGKGVIAVEGCVAGSGLCLRGIA